MNELPAPVQPFAPGYHALRLRLMRNGIRNLRAKDIVINELGLSAVLDTGHHVAWSLDTLDEITIDIRP